MANRIHVARADLERLRDLVDQHSEGRDAPAAARLADELDRAVVVERPLPDVAGIGSRVRYRDVDSGAERTVTLVWPTDANAGSGRVSVLAPIGAALLGLSPGDGIDWPLPGGRSAHLEIVQVEPPAEEAAAFA
jgi:regulator of nucleoside diphosphate kinase